MSAKIVDTLSNLSAAEEFFHALEVPFSPEVVHVNRLHILKRFQQYLTRNPVGTTLSDVEQRALYRQHLQQAYEDFLGSTPAAEKVFKVFQQASGIQSFPLDQFKAALHTKQRLDM